MALSEMLIHSVSFTHPISTTDSVGGETQSEATLYASMPCCFQPIKAFQQYVYSQQNIRAEHAIYTDRSLSNLSNGDYAYFNSERYVITGIRNVIHDGTVWEVLVYRFTD